MPATTRTGQTARVDEIDADPAEGLRQWFRGRTGGIGQPQHVDLVDGPKRGPDEPRPIAAAQQHARRSGVGAAQLQFVGVCA